MKYDFFKVMLFNLLYSGGRDADKADLLYRLVKSEKTHYIHNRSQKLLSAIETLTIIPCILVGEAFGQNSRFLSETEQ